MRSIGTTPAGRRAARRGEGSMSETRQPMNPVAKVAIFIAVKLAVLSALTVVILRWKGLI